MALFPVFAGGAQSASALGVFKPHSTQFSSASSEGGRLAVLVNESGTLKVANGANVTTATGPLVCLQDEQGVSSTLETAVGRMLTSYSSPVVVGPATFLGSNRISVWQESGWFMTDQYDLAVDAYGEPTGIVPGTNMTHTDGLLNVGGADGATRIYFMGMVDDVSDLFGSYVSPAPTAGMFAQKAPILIYQK
jgi:hypothetical protein